MCVRYEKSIEGRRKEGREWNNSCIQQEESKYLPLLSWTVPAIPLYSHLCTKCRSLILKSFMLPLKDCNWSNISPKIIEGDGVLLLLQKFKGTEQDILKHVNCCSIVQQFPSMHKYGDWDQVEQIETAQKTSMQTLIVTLVQQFPSRFMHAPGRLQQSHHTTYH